MGFSRYLPSLRVPDFLKKQATPYAPPAARAVPVPIQHGTALPKKPIRQIKKIPALLRKWMASKSNVASPPRTDSTSSVGTVSYMTQDTLSYMSQETMSFMSVDTPDSPKSSLWNMAIAPGLTAEIEPASDSPSRNQPSVRTVTPKNTDLSDYEQLVLHLFFTETKKNIAAQLKTAISKHTDADEGSINRKAIKKEITKITIDANKALDDYLLDIEKYSVLPDNLLEKKLDIYQAEINNFKKEKLQNHILQSAIDVNPSMPSILSDNTRWDSDYLHPEHKISFEDVQLHKENLTGGSFGFVSEFINKNGDIFIGKCSKNVIKNLHGQVIDDLATEMKAYQTIYHRAGAHPNLVNTYGIAIIPSRSGSAPVRALLMDKVTGPTGNKVFDKLRESWHSGAISSADYWGAIQFIGRKLLDVTRHLAEAQIVHNDIKPENFLIDEKTGEPIVIDLGLWSHKNRLAPGRTDYFASVESRLSDVVDERSDVFSVGATLLSGVEGDTVYDKKNGIFVEEKKAAGDKTNYEIVIPRNGFARQQRVVLDERHLIQRQPGTYNAKTFYTNAIQSSLLNDKASKPSPKRLQDYPFFNDSLIGDQEAKEVIKKVIAFTDDQRKNIIPVKNISAAEIQQTILDNQNLLAQLSRYPDLPDFAQFQKNLKKDPAITSFFAHSISEDTRSRVEFMASCHADRMIGTSIPWLAVTNPLLATTAWPVVKSGVTGKGVAIKAADQQQIRRPEAGDPLSALHHSASFPALKDNTVSIENFLRDTTALWPIRDPELARKINDLSGMVTGFRMLVDLESDDPNGQPPAITPSIKSMDVRSLQNFIAAHPDKIRAREAGSRPNPDDQRD